MERVEQLIMSRPWSMSNRSEIQRLRFGGSVPHQSLGEIQALWGVMSEDHSPFAFLLYLGENQARLIDPAALSPERVI